MLRVPHENVATVLVDPAALREVELDLMTRDLWVWPVATAGVHVDGPRAAFQLRRRLVEARRGAWDLAANWTPVWVAFGMISGSEPVSATKIVLLLGLVGCVVGLKVTH